MFLFWLPLGLTRLVLEKMRQALQLGVCCSAGGACWEDHGLGVDFNSP